MHDNQPQKEMHVQPIMMPISTVNNVSYSTATFRKMLITWSSLHRGAFRDNKQCAIQHARSSQAGNYSSSDQHARRVRHSTNQGTDLKEDEEAEKCPLSTIVRELSIHRTSNPTYFGHELHIYLSCERLEDRTAYMLVSRLLMVPIGLQGPVHVPSELICSSVPSNVIQRIEIIGDARNGRDDNGSIEKHEKDHESHGGQDGEKLEAVSPLGLRGWDLDQRPVSGGQRVAIVGGLFRTAERT